MAMISIGGNDVEFANTINKCVTSSCMAGNGGKALKTKTLSSIYNIYDDLVALYTELHNASPGTRLFVTGYPSFISDDDKAKCPANASFNREERVFIKQSLVYLNDVIEAAAKKAGVTYIDIENSIAGHEMCRTNKSSPNYMNGILYGNDIEVANLKVIAQETFHPKAIGYEAIAKHIDQNYNELITYKNPACPNEPTGYCTGQGTRAPLPKGITLSITTNKIITNLKALGRMIFVSLGHGIKAGTSLSGLVFSEPRSLGTITIDQNGNSNDPFILPADLKPGYHTLVVSGTSDTGEPFEYMQTFFYAPTDAATGPCGYLPYSNVDQDADGIDDACDDTVDVDDQLFLDDPETILIDPNASYGVTAINNQDSQVSSSVKASENADAPKLLADNTQLFIATDTTDSSLLVPSSQVSSTESESQTLGVSKQVGGLPNWLLYIAGGIGIFIMLFIFSAYRLRNK